MHLGFTIFPADYAIPLPELAREAEQRGFESIWVAEHSHIPVSRKSPWPGGAELPKMYYDTLDPFVALAAAASVTSRIKLATGICLVVQRDPIHTAKQVASLDRVSNGRFLFVAWSGFRPVAFRTSEEPSRWRLDSDGPRRFEPVVDPDGRHFLDVDWINFGDPCYVAQLQPKLADGRQEPPPLDAVSRTV